MGCRDGLGVSSLPRRRREAGRRDLPASGSGREIVEVGVEREGMAKDTARGMKEGGRIPGW